MEYRKITRIHDDATRENEYFRTFTFDKTISLNLEEKSKKYVILDIIQEPSWSLLYFSEYEKMSRLLVASKAIGLTLKHAIAHKSRKKDWGYWQDSHKRDIGISWERIPGKGWSHRTHYTEGTVFGSSNPLVVLISVQRREGPLKGTQVRFSRGQVVPIWLYSRCSYRKASYCATMIVSKINSRYS